MSSANCWKSSQPHAARRFQPRNFAGPCMVVLPSIRSSGSPSSVRFESWLKGHSLESGGPNNFMREPTTFGMSADGSRSQVREGDH